MNSFRSILRHRTDKEDKSNLYNVLMEMEKSAHEQWLAQMAADKHWNQTGYPHLLGIERNIDRAVPTNIKETFSNTEIYILLASVLLHDIGKLENRKNTEHYQLSCKRILKNWPFLKIPNEEYARWIAVICCSHGWKTGPQPLISCSLRNEECSLTTHNQRGRVKTVCDRGHSEIDLLPIAEDGPVRLKWIAALLRLGDETENNQSRSAIDYSRDDDVNKHSIWRHHVNSVEFRLMGNCIVFHINSLNEIEPVNWHWMHKGISAVNEMLENNGKPSGWRVVLQEMGVDYQLAFVQIQLPTQILIDEEELEKIGKLSFEYIDKNRILNKKGVHVGNLQNDIQTILEKLQKAKKQVCACVEPIFEKWPGALSRICCAVNRVDQSVVILDQNEFLTVEMLAYEAGIPDVGFVELALKRIIDFKKCLENGCDLKINETINNKLSRLIRKTPELVVSSGRWKIIRKYTKKM